MVHLKAKKAGFGPCLFLIYKVQKERESKNTNLQFLIILSILIQIIVQLFLKI